MQRRALLLTLVAVCFLTLSAHAKKSGNGNGNGDDDDEDSHKHLVPVSGLDVAGAVCAAVAAFLAAGGGIGGGGILVPIYIVVAGFSTKAAIPLSNVTIFGAAIMNTILNVQKRHPLADRPMIDWDLMLMMQPSTIVGAILGAYINVLLPAVILIIMLVVVLAYTTLRTARKGLALYKKESAQSPRLLRRRSSASSTEIEEAKEQEMIPTATAEGSTEPDQNDAENPSEVEEVPSNGDNKTDDKAPTTRAIQLLEEDSHLDWRKPTILAIMLGVVNLMTGLATTQFECGSSGYWGLNVAVIPLLFVAVFFISKYLIDRHREKEAVAYTFAPGDVKWNMKNTLNCASLCVVAGILAGMFGIGGGMIQGPLMLEMGVHPQTVAATSASLILYTSATAAISFWLFGMLAEDYAVLFFVVGFLATWGGQLSAQKITDITGRQSFIIFLIAGIIVLSTCLMTYVGVAELVADPSSIADAEGLCG